MLLNRDGRRSSPLVSCAWLLTGVLTCGLRAQPGALDPLFDGDGQVTTELGGANEEALGIAVQEDGRIVAVGKGGPSNRFAVARYTSTGQLDGTFNGTGT